MRFSPGLLLLFLAGWLLGSTSGLAADWQATFVPRAVVSYLTEEGQRIIVVGAGDPNDELIQAASALEAALRASNRFPLVMNGQSLGKVVDLDDPTIAEKAARLPLT